MDKPKPIKELTLRDIRKICQKHKVQTTRIMTMKSQNNNKETPTNKAKIEIIKETLKKEE